jgi:hypothetical protein
MLHWVGRAVAVGSWISRQLILKHLATFSRKQQAKAGSHAA